ncbi:MAG: helix-turn-helix domain-containing protein [Candidatus Nanopelagicales bacterium]|nr:helix-turn-helix domain-containing protein [Candidatus Nanopelagicales bacterium]
MARIDVGGLGEYIREQRTLAQLSLRQLAASSEVSNPYLSQIERGLRRPSAEILGQIAKALRISAETLYVKAGILEDTGETVSVTAAIMATSALTDRQRRVLLEIYAAFQTENAAQPTEHAIRGEGNDADSPGEEMGDLPLPRVTNVGGPTKTGDPLDAAS